MRIKNKIGLLAVLAICLSGCSNSSDTTPAALPVTDKIISDSLKETMDRLTENSIRVGFVMGQRYEICKEFHGKDCEDVDALLLRYNKIKEEN